LGSESSSTRLRVVFILGAPHSGSTLLDLLLGGHHRTVSTGELKALSADWRSKGKPVSRIVCSCGSVGLACPFWSRVAEHLQGSLGVGLDELDVGSEDEGVFSQHNRALFEAIRTVSGKDLMVDSSKDVGRMKRLERLDGFEIHPIHLVRSIYGVAYSQLRKGRDPYEFGRGWAVIQGATRRTLAHCEHEVVHYENLVRRPREEVARLMRWLDLKFEEDQLAWDRPDIHLFAGNRMRHRRTGVIREDDEWKLGLRTHQKLLLAVIALRRFVPPLRSRFIQYWKSSRRG